jgi:hypothetical protein
MNGSGESFFRDMRPTAGLRASDGVQDLRTPDKIIWGKIAFNQRGMIKRLILSTMVAAGSSSLGIVAQADETQFYLRSQRFGTT